MPQNYKYIDASILELEQLYNDGHITSHELLEHNVKWAKTILMRAIALQEPDRNTAHIEAEVNKDIQDWLEPPQFNSGDLVVKTISQPDDACGNKIPDQLSGLGSILNDGKDKHHVEVLWYTAPQPPAWVRPSRRMAWAREQGQVLQERRIRLIKMATT